MQPPRLATNRAEFNVGPEEEGKMKRLIPACAIAVALAVSAYAQDTTVKSKTKVKADDARTVILKGCLQQGNEGETFTLTGATKIVGEDLEAKSKVKTDVDEDETKVKSRTRTEVEHPEAVGTAGTVTTYELMPRHGVNLTSHVGHTVEITALMVDPAKGGDDDAEVRIKDKTKVKTDDAPDAKIESKSKMELPRGEHARLTVVSVKHVSPTCTM
jgi:hypothetical protein